MRTNASRLGDKIGKIIGVSQHLALPVVQRFSISLHKRIPTTQRDGCR